MTAIVEARGVWKSFGTVPALRGLDLDVRSGRVTALLGPNGAGKSTFLGSLATLVLPDAGELRVAGIDVLAEPAAVRRTIAVVGQQASVEPTMTGRENLVMVARLAGQPSHQAGRSADQALAQLGLSEVGGLLARTYSGGMRRRLDLGASLVVRPKLILLDEPTAGLDPRSRLELWQAMSNLVSEGTDVLLTTQYMEDVEQVASDLIIIDHGRTVAAGTPTELRNRLGGDVLEVRPVSFADHPEFVRVLSAVGSAGARIDHDRRHVSVPVEGGHGRLVSAIQALEVAGLEFDDVALRRFTLDEVFLGLTGSPATDEPSDEERGARVPSIGLLPADPAGSARVQPSDVGLVATALLTARRLITLVVRTPIVLLARTLQCAVFLLMFHVAFGDAVTTGTSLSYTDFQIPGFLVTVVLWCGFNIAPGVAEDAELGVYDRLRSLPIPRAGVMVGRALADTLLLILALVVAAILGLALGFRPQGTVAGFTAGFLVLVVVGFAFTWVFIAIGLHAGSAQAAQGLSSLALPFFFVSAANVPVDQLPERLQWFAANQPITVTMNAVRSLIHGGPEMVGIDHSTLHWVLLSLVWAAGIGLFFGAAAVHRFSRTR